MVRNQKVTGKAMAFTTGVGIGTGLSAALTVLGALIVAWLVEQESITKEGIGYGAMVILLVSSVAGAWTAAALVKHRLLLACMITGGLYLLCLLGISVMCFGSQFQGIVPTVLLIVGGSSAAAMIVGRGSAPITSRRHNHRYG